MASAIFHHQNCCVNSHRFKNSRPSLCPSLSSTTNPNLFHFRRHQNHCSVVDNQIRSPMVIKFPTQTNLVLGQVKILKRGETVPPSLIENELAPISDEQTGVCSINADFDDVAFFVGSSFSASPSPSMVPFPRLLAINRDEMAKLGFF